MKPYIQRKIYQTRIDRYIGKELIKVLIGQRRVGKSYLLFQTMDAVRQQYSNPHIIYINLELNEFEKLNNSEALYEYIKTKSVNEQLNFLFIDEIQMVQGFEIALKSLMAEGGYDIYCTGSNAKLLSGELATYLSGRYIEIPVYSLSFNEFLLFHNLENSSQSLDTYLKYGGLPYLKHLELTDDVVFDYLKNIYQAILFRDVVSRFQVRNVDFLNRLTKYLAGEVGNIISARSINKFLKSQNINLSISAILNYLDYLTIAIFISKVSRTDVYGKKVFEVGEKFYFNDIGLRNAIASFSPFDLGKIIENVVYLHLKIHSFNVLVGKEKDKVIDFVCEKNREKMYLQVALRITEKQTMEREFGNLLSVKNNYPKFVITLDEYSGSSYEGIQHISLRKFLSEIN